jgi:hypothetical protein
MTVLFERFTFAEAISFPVPRMWVRTESIVMAGEGPPSTSSLCAASEAVDGGPAAAMTMTHESVISCPSPHFRFHGDDD